MSDVVLPTRLMGLLGAKKTSSHQCGRRTPIHPIQPGDLHDDHGSHYNRQFQVHLIGPNIDELGTRFPDMSEVYSRSPSGCDSKMRCRMWN